jgi:AraC-like DNA-binding protein
VAFLVGGALFLWRIILAHRRLVEKNRQLFDTVQQMMREADERQQALSRQPEETLSASQQLYNRICQLMREQQPYTDSDLNRDSLAQMLATNYNAVATAIRECGEGQTIGDFLDDWRIRHAAHLVAATNDPVGLIVEQSGFSSRSHFNTLFREKFKMTPSEYRNIAKEKAGK